MRSLHQVLAVARMEFRLAFRRSAPVVVTALVGLLFIAGIGVELLSALPALAASRTMTSAQQANWMAAGFTLDQYLPIMKSVTDDMLVIGSTLPWLIIFIALLLLPAATISAVPAERVFGVEELLRSTPLTGGRYLAGKTAGMLLAVFSVWAVMLVLFFALTNLLYWIYFQYGLPWNTSLYLLELGVLDGSLYLAWGTILGVTIGVYFHSRRVAIFPGLIAGGLSIFFWVTAFRPPVSDGSLPVADRLEYYLLENHYSTMNAVTGRFGTDLTMFGFTRQVSLSQVVLMVLTLLAGVAILALLARLWLQWKENF